MEGPDECKGLARIAEACQYLGLSRTKIYLLMDAGELGYAKIGRSRRIPWADLVRLIAQKTVQQARKTTNKKTTGDK